MFGLYIIFHIAGRCFQSFFSSLSSHSLTSKMHLPVCQSAAATAITASTHLTLWKGSGGCSGVPQPQGSPWAVGVLAVSHSRYPGGRQGGICSSKLWVVWFPFLPPQSLRAAHFSKVTVTDQGCKKQRDSHGKKRRIHRESHHPHKISSASWCSAGKSWHSSAGGALLMRKFLNFVELSHKILYSYQ